MSTKETKIDEFGQDRAAFLPSWDFAANPVLVGTVTEREKVEGVTSEITGETRDVDLYTVATDDGEPFTVWGSGVLARALPKHIGHRVRIEDKGIDTSRPAGRQPRMFEVRCATCTAEGK